MCTEGGESEAGRLESQGFAGRSVSWAFAGGDLSVLKKNLAFTGFSFSQIINLNTLQLTASSSAQLE